MNVLITLNEGLGENLGPNFTLTCDVEGWSETTNITELLAGVIVVIPDEATIVYIESLGLCLNILELPIEVTTTTTTTTEIIITTTTTTTVIEPCTEGYGLLYNYYAATDTRKITSSDDWSVPTEAQWDAFSTQVGGTVPFEAETILDATWTPSGGSCTPTNTYMYNARGSGKRSELGVFDNEDISGLYWSSTSFNTTLARYREIYCIIYGDGVVQDKKIGMSVRLIYTGAGTPTSYTGNDGKVYRVVLIGTQYWLADNLQETKFRNGDIIPHNGIDNADNFTNAEWAALTTAGVCPYNNDVSNVGCDFLFPGD